MTSIIWDHYKTLLGPEVIDQLFQLANVLKGAKIVHVNSTRTGGGVAEILAKMVPLMQGLGLDTHWEVIEGNEDFFLCSKAFHNMFQSQGANLPDPSLLRNYEKTNKKNGEKLAPLLEQADYVMIHDPQPLAIIQSFPKRKAKWIWRCHIETSSSPQILWNYLRPSIDLFDASVFSLETVNQVLPHPIYVIPPSIDPFSEKNVELDPAEVHGILDRFNIDRNRPIVLQVSRFDTFKDPKGVIRAYQLSKKYNPGIQLVLVGGRAADDPEGDAVLKDVLAAAEKDPDIHVLDLHPDSHRIVNGLQRGADLILQKSIREGFGLTVTEALWKSKPVIGGNTGGIRVQILDHYTGFLVNTPEGAANRISYLLQNREVGKQFGIAGKRLVKEHYLITRHLRDYLSMMVTLIGERKDRIEL